MKALARFEKVVLFSGGLDSSLVLARAVSESGDKVLALFVSYGQQHEERELEHARAVARYYRVGLHKVTIQGLLGSALLSSGGDMADPREVFVPGRNAAFVALAASVAEGVGASEVLLGILWDPTYDDCTPEFVENMNVALTMSVTLIAPLLSMTKKAVVEAAFRELVPVHLTWSCFRGGHCPCLRCAACKTRAAAFKEAGENDPWLPGT